MPLSDTVLSWIFLVGLLKFFLNVTSNFYNSTSVKGSVSLSLILSSESSVVKLREVGFCLTNNDFLVELLTASGVCLRLVSEFNTGFCKCCLSYF